MQIRLAGALSLALFTPVAAHGQFVPPQTVRFHTNLGDIDVNLLPDSAPKTVANFLNYMNRGAYNGSIIHRSVPGFIIQGGGFTFTNTVPPTFPTIAADPTVVNEFSVSNTRGTIAMAKLGTDPNSATSQWFFNLVNNASNLDNTNGGFTVFGRVTSSAGLAIMDTIARVPVPNPGPLSSPLDQIPLLNWKSGNVQVANLVQVLSVATVNLTPQPVISANGVISVGSFGGIATAAPGSLVEIYGSNLSGSTRGWAAADFDGNNAPTSLDLVTVTIGGQPAYVNYISPVQVNVQVPANVPTGGALPVIVTYNGQSSAPVNLTVNSVAAGLLAPPSFNVGGKQYVAAVHASNNTIVSNGNIPGQPLAPAIPGETLIIYGIGFGALTPAGTPVAGQIAQGQTALSTPVQFSIAQLTAQTLYAGLAPGLVGVYQFNLVVPAATPNGDQPLQVLLGGQTLSQSLFIPVQK